MLIRFGAGVTAASGSIGGTTAARNRYGNYFRARTKPVNPQSERQLLARSIMSSLVEVWRTALDDDQRAAWEVYAANIAWNNKLGESIKLSGFNHFCRSNAALLAAGGESVDDAPTELTLPAADATFAVAVTSADQKIAITFDDEAPWCDLANAFMSVQMSLPRGEGVSFVGGPFRLAGALAGAIAEPPTSPAVLPCPFPVGPDQLVVCRARIILPDARVSGFFRSRAIVDYTPAP